MEHDTDKFNPLEKEESSAVYKNDGEVDDEPWIEAQGGLYDNQNSLSVNNNNNKDAANTMKASTQEDDQIDKEDVDDGDDDVDWGMNHQLFADPDPIQDFHLEWQQVVPPSDDNDESITQTRTISIDLRGHKPENGQTLSSTGLTLWRGSELLCDYLLQHAHELFASSSPSMSSSQDKRRHDQDDDTRHRRRHAGTTVLELGAGLGVCGILAHRLGAAHVVMTDGDSETLQWLRANVQRNILPTALSSSSSSSSNQENDASGAETLTIITCAQLQWGLNLERFQQRHGIDEYDIIMASDIIYVEEILHPLWNTVHTLLSPRHGSKFCLSFVRRNVSWDLVLAVAAEYDMELIEIPSVRIAAGQEEEDDRHGQLSNQKEEIVDLTAATPRDGVFVFQKKP